MSDPGNRREGPPPQTAVPRDETPAPAPPSESPILRRILLHLLKHQGDLVRFEASPRTTEAGILNSLPEDDPAEVKHVLRVLVQSQRLLCRSQYVVGTSDPKMVYTLTLSGRRMALELRQREAESAANSLGPRQS